MTSEIDICDTNPAAEFLRPATIQTLFWRPRLMTQSPSLAYVPFLFWLSSTLRPRSIEVLGVGDGSSYFALCQALDKLSISGRCRGFGYWTGETPGLRLQTPPVILRKHEAMLYEDISSLSAGRRPTEDLSRNGMENLDLLLVDLDNLPEGENLDGQVCLSRLHPNGVLVLHGTNDLDRRKGDGADLMKLIETCQRIEFQANAGMTVIFKGKELPFALRALIDSCSDGVLPTDIEAVFRRSGQSLEAMVQAQASDAAAAQTQQELLTTQAALDAAEAALKEMTAVYEQCSRNLAQVQGEVFTLHVAQAEMEESLARENARLRSESEARGAAERTMRFEETAALTRLLEEARVAANVARAEAARTRKSLQAEVDRLRAQSEAWEQRVEALLRSSSWRITAPVRLIKQSLTRHR
ncbi:hypothetical protein [Rubellimicrobium mesophilum]|uniref:hypothetical protein n=1 Tax=Rubellimicrobium mesophilum TaxID=1123067 RepID=UPI000565DD70|nr:hypothetical protein [Rubellimicrobium mesophilum]